MAFQTADSPYYGTIKDAAPKMTLISHTRENDAPIQVGEKTFDRYSFVMRCPEIGRDLTMKMPWDYDDGWRMDLATCEVDFPVELRPYGIVVAAQVTI